jgi:hypothetical protein
MPRRVTQPLFISENEVARRVGVTPVDWKAKAHILERDGLPKIDAMWGMRYWPAVSNFLDRRYGLSKVPVSQPDGPENLNEL